MKKILAATLISLTILGGAVPALAKSYGTDTDTDKKGSSDVLVDFVDNDPSDNGTPGTDPSNPEGENPGTTLKLINVPERFKQKTILSATGSYKVQFSKDASHIEDDNVDDKEISLATLKDKYVVFNDFSKRAWQLQADLNPVIVDRVTGITKGLTKDITISSLKVEGDVVFKSAESPDQANNTGFLTKDFEAGTLEFKDHNLQLKAGDSIDVKDLIIFTLSDVPAPTN